MNAVFVSKNAAMLCAYAKEKYGDELEFLWQKFPKNAVLRKKENKKWYAAFCVVDKTKLSLKESGLVEIVNLKLDPQEVLAFVDNQTCFQAYHIKNIG